ncbi:hypothetical protein BT96DRAFT_842672 [Gymnopus androsaceus JB14]|uniref:CxC2-like cysteine cluster KDZ transposase-associated domain-containing protein n=1 Tax=Gymnopus androsaceus JB14 TaxID=1447944 RepID=A0A6A4GF49_9AGAR|nr:hypothetical protein BT96DRAFT_842672 [Gymnopus androsaceus JB14]
MEQKFFEDCSLQELGYAYDLDIPNSTSCSYPEPSPDNSTIIYVDKLHHVKVSFCGCPFNMGKACCEQIMLNKWPPAMTERPKTVCTFCALELFHMLSH